MTAENHSDIQTIIVASDIHGAHEALERLMEYAAQANADLLVLAGDTCPACSTAIVRSIWYSSIPVLMVRGNCESPWDFQEAGLPIPPIYRTERFGERTLLVTHGDRFPSPAGLPVHLSENDLFVCGHTHRPVIRHEEGRPWILNPGSTTYPRSSEGATFALVDGDGISIRSFDRNKPIAGLQAYW
ncbi:MAG: metallophosphoesterase family protein [Sphaerochaetaceae bacterium]|jgi:putative phosphoesterase